MTIPVLVVDKDEEYRNLTVKTLNGSGQYQAIPADSAKAALTQISKSKAQIAIVDTDLQDMEGTDLIGQLLHFNKHLLIIAVVEGEDGETEELKSLGVRSILEKPYFLPELPSIITSAVHGTSPPAPTPQERVPPIPAEKAVLDEIPEWLSNPEQAEDFLTRLFEEHSAQALLIIRGTSLWARSSQLAEHHAQQIAQNVIEHEGGGPSKKSIVGYLRIEELEAEFLLYATHLKQDFKLVLLYDSEKPFSLARRQAKYVSQLILTMDPADLPPPAVAPISEEPAIPSTHPQDSTLPSDWIPQSPASVEDFPQLTELDIPPADPELSSLEEAAISAPVDLDLPSLPTDWFPKRPTPSSHLPFLAPDEPDDPSLQGENDQDDEDPGTPPSSPD